jgi:hypothetical protein
MLYFLSRLPTPQEMLQCHMVTFTSDREWEPLSDHFNEVERATKLQDRYTDPQHLHFDKQEVELDGRTINSITTGVSSNAIFHDPYLHTFDQVSLYRNIL